jgi:hypothetical protein
MSEFDTIAERALGEKQTFAGAKQNEHARDVLQGIVDGGDASPAEQAALRALKLKAPADQQEIGATGATYRGAAQGLTLSSRDELSGALNWLSDGMTPDAYRIGRDESRALDAEAQQAFPEEFIRVRRQATLALWRSLAAWL